MTSPRVVPDDVRAAFLGQSKHKRALPARLEAGVLDQPHDPTAGRHPATLRVLIGHGDEGFYLDHDTESQEASSYQTARARKRGAEHNARVREVLRQKGFA